MKSQFSVSVMTGSSSVSDSKGTSTRSYASSSGYRGDLDVLQQYSRNSNKRSHPPHVIDLIGTERSPFTGSIVSEYHHLHHHTNKRQKQQEAEANFLASTAYQELARGGLTLQKIGSSSRALSLFPPNSKVDFSKVKRLTAKDYDLQASTVTEDEHPVSSLPSYDMHLLTSLVRESSSFYRSILSAEVFHKSMETSMNTTSATTSAPLTKQNLITTQNLMRQPPSGKDGISRAAGAGGEEEAANGAGGGGGTTGIDFESTSSMTDSSDDGNTPEEAPDAAAGVAEAEASSAAPNAATATTVSDTSTSSTESFVCMGDALANSKLPRLIALSFRPFVVVHVNAAFTALTGQHSVETLGRPLHDMFHQDPVVAAALQTSCANFTLSSLDGQAIRMLPSSDSNNDAPSNENVSSSNSSTRSSNSSSSSNSNKSNRRRKSATSLCTVHVRPIGGPDDSNHCTHYLLEIVKVGDKSLLHQSENEEMDEGELVQATTTTTKKINSLSSYFPLDFSMGVMG